jgi:hypothetical protein
MIFVGCIGIFVIVTAISAATTSIEKRLDEVIRLLKRVK